MKRRALDEWARYSRWVCARMGVEELRLLRVELTKIDGLEWGAYWNDYSDLVKLITVAGVFDAIRASEPSHLDLRFAETVDENKLVVRVTVGDAAVKIESRCIMPANADPEELLTNASARLNEVFFGLLELDQLERLGVET